VGCTGANNLYPLAVEGDARFTEFSVYVGMGELIVSWPSRAIGGSPADDTGTAGQVVGFLGGAEILNRSLLRDPARVYLDAAAINAYVAEHSTPFNVVMVPLGIGFCAWDGTLTYVIG